MFDLPKNVGGTPEEQVAYLRKYLFSLIEKLNELEMKVGVLETTINSL
jgi:hypothetical protein